MQVRILLQLTGQYAVYSLSLRQYGEARVRMKPLMDFSEPTANNIQLRKCVTFTVPTVNSRYRGDFSKGVSDMCKATSHIIFTRWESATAHFLTKILLNILGQRMSISLNSHTA